MKIKWRHNNTYLLLEFMSKSKDEQQRATAAFINASKKLPENS